MKFQHDTSDRKLLVGPEGTERVNHGDIKTLTKDIKTRQVKSGGAVKP